MENRSHLISGMVIFLALAMVLAGGTPNAAAQDDPGTDAALAKTEEVIVLDTVGFWRMFHELKPAVMATDDGLVELTDGSLQVKTPTTAPPADWTSPEFDDSNWVRRPALGAIRSPSLARLCLRGKFQVDNLANVQGLRVSVGYHGGVIVYVNGQEIARNDLQADIAQQGNLLARPYQREAFLDDKGNLLQTATMRNWRRARSDTVREHAAIKGREIRDLIIPQDMLKNGVNVLAIELHRAAYDQVVDEKKPPRVYSFHSLYDLAWNTCEILSVRMTAAKANGLRPAATRPQGFRVWNSSLLADDHDQDFGDPAEKLRPVPLMTARNGAASGKVVVGSTQAIRGLSAQVGNFRSSDGARIDASAARVRYATAWGQSSLTYPFFNETSPYPVAVNPLGALQEMPDAEYPVVVSRAGQLDVKLPGQPDHVPGAVVPVWVTVQVPATADAGQYIATLTIKAEGQAAVEVPLHLEIVDWKLPDTQDRRTWVEMVQSPDTLVMEYDLEAWSDRHIEMIGRSFRFIGDVGSRVVYVPLIAQSHFGNAHSMVRWIDKGNGEYEFDFSLMEKYLDAAEQHMGKPRIICLHLWDAYMIPTARSERGAGDVRVFDHLEKAGALVGGGPVVTVLDPASGATSLATLPRYDQPGGTEAWTKLFAELRQRLRRRGIEDAMMLGTFPDQWATRDEVAALKDATGNLPWIVQSHNGASPNDGIYGLANCGYQSRVWRLQHATTLENWSLHGWNRKDLITMFVRVGGFASFPNAAWRSYAELAITGDQRGVARLGAEYWNVLKNPRGQRVGTVTELYPQSSWRNLDPWAALLAPGSDGPVATTRYELLREGLQDCEARIVLEEALITPELRAAIGEELATRTENVLRNRLVTLWRSNSTLLLSPLFSGSPIYSRGIAGHTWFEGSNWQAESRELMLLAAEVQRKLGKR